MKKLWLFISILLLQTLTAQVPPRPQPPKLYNNLSKEFPGFLSADEAAMLEEKLEVFSNETSNQICVVIVDDLHGMDASSFAFQLANEWGVGQKGFNNGIVVLVKPTGGAGQRDLFIATGYGLEGAIPDLMTKRIREEMYPYMKEGRNYEALDHGTGLLMQLAKGEISVKDYERKSNKRSKRIPLVPLIIILIVILLLRNRFRGGGGGYTFSRSGRNIFWGGIGGFGGGRGWGGGSSGGGWGGFGGGGFGGGGSGGKW